MSVAKVIDTSKDGLAVITGGASGFGFNMATRLIKNGMAVAVLDVSDKELANAEKELKALNGGEYLGVKCNVTKIEDCEAAAKAVAAGFPNKKISLLFNNAGISGRAGDPNVPERIISGTSAAWRPVFEVNVFGAVNIIKAFVPGMIEKGPLSSGKKSFVVTTSSVVGLLNHNIGPYSVSKMATTAVCEQFSHELESMGDKAAHVSPRSLHPTVAATNFLTGRGEDSVQTRGDEMKQGFAAAGSATADYIVDGLFKALDEDKFYCVVDHATDIPTSKQVAMRMEDQMTGRRPRVPEQLGSILKLMEPAKYKAREEALSVGASASKL